MSLSIRAKIIVAIGGPLLAAYAVMLASEYYYGKQQALRNMELQWTEFTVRKAAELDGKLDAAEGLVQTLARTVSKLPDLKPEQIEMLLRDTLLAYPKCFGMCAAFEPNAFPGAPKNYAPYFCQDGLDAAGNPKLRYVDIAVAAPNYADLPWYKPAKLGKPFWTEPYFDTGVGERIMCTYTAPIYRQNKFCGVLTVDILSEDLLEALAKIDVGSGYCTLVSKNGTFISHPNPQLVMHESIFGLADRARLSGLAEAGRQMVAQKAGVRRIRDSESGRPQWMIFAPVESTGWSLAAVIPEREVLAPIYDRMVRVFLIPTAGALAAIVLVLVLSGRVTRPLVRLAKAAESLGHGNLDARVPEVRGRDEVAKLSHTFNTMTVELKSNIDGRIREESARRGVEAELHAAREIQASLLPPPLPPEQKNGFDLHAVNAPAKLVAGDFYDFFFIDARRLAVVVADVSGKGVPAAMYMAITRTKLRDFASPEKSPAQVLDEVNRSLAQENEGGMFVTLFLGYYDIAAGELVYASAGHNPPYVVRGDGRLDALDSTGPLLAPFPDAEFADARCVLQPNDLLFLFTDGITEAGMREEGELFGEKRLEKLLLDLASEPLSELCRKTIQTVTDFSNGDLADDATILTVRRTV